MDLLFGIIPHCLSDSKLTALVEKELPSEPGTLGGRLEEDTKRGIAIVLQVSPM